MGAAAGILTVVALHAPWARSGRVDRTSLDLLASAGSVGVITGWVQTLALFAWWMVTLLVAGSSVARVAGRARLADQLLVLLPAPVVALAVAVARSEVVTARWGLVTAVLAASAAALCAGVASWRDATAAETGGYGDGG
ncbi:MAG: hypothetical protein D6683_14740 [Actinomyces sp.]|nr:MAG: hypothetical protein D6683_14740 [Actinomyces sp.]